MTLPIVSQQLKNYYNYQFTLFLQMSTSYVIFYILQYIIMYAIILITCLGTLCCK